MVYDYVTPSYPVVEKKNQLLIIDLEWADLLTNALTPGEVEILHTVVDFRELVILIASIGPYSDIHNLIYEYLVYKGRIPSYGDDVIDQVLHKAIDIALGAYISYFSQLFEREPGDAIHDLLYMYYGKVDADRIALYRRDYPRFTTFEELKAYDPLTVRLRVSEPITDGPLRSSNRIHHPPTGLLRRRSSPKDY